MIISADRLSVKQERIKIMAGHRRGRINDAVKEELGSILREIKDPRITDNFVTVTAAEVAPDMKTARIFFSSLADDNMAEETRRLSPKNKEILKGLQSAAGFMRRELARRINLRTTPELTFVYDESLRHGARINTILNDIERKKVKNEDDE